MAMVEHRFVRIWVLWQCLQSASHFFPPGMGPVNRTQKASHALVVKIRQGYSKVSNASGDRATGRYMSGTCISENRGPILPIL